VARQVGSLHRSAKGKPGEHLSFVMGGTLRCHRNHHAVYPLKPPAGLPLSPGAVLFPAHVHDWLKRQRRVAHACTSDKVPEKIAGQA
jgi:hypothetical protein